MTMLLGRSELSAQSDTFLLLVCQLLLHFSGLCSCLGAILY